MRDTTYTRLYTASHAAIKLEAVKRGVTMPDVIEELVRAVGLEVPRPKVAVGQEVMAFVQPCVDTRGE